MTLADHSSTGDSVTTPTDAGAYRFCDVEVNTRLLQVRRGGEVVPTEPQVFDVLVFLIDHRDRVVAKEELLDAVWGDRFVSESALSSRIKDARRAVGDDGRRQEFIRTVHGRGYQFIAEMQEVARVDATRGAPGVRDSFVPASTRPLVARERELGDVISLLSRTRLVTVVGTGGVGKTRLALEVARRWDFDTDDRVVFVPLAAVSDDSDVAPAVAAALGVSSGTSDKAASIVVEALKELPTLIVVDNFEHVAAAAPVVAEILQAVPSARCLVTSRERLRLSQEQTYDLAPLGLTGDEGSGSPAGAVVLFAEAARAAIADFEVTPETVDDVSAICSMLDGLPLAIELAAAQLRYFPVHYLRGHLEASPITVSDDSRDRPARHRTVRDTVAWSHSMLTPAQQKLFAGLSAFVGGWSVDGAVAVSDVSPDETVTILKALLDKKLIERSLSSAGQPRFAMLHLIREFASRQLDEAGGRERVLDRHARFIADYAESVDASRFPATPHRFVEDFDAERHNILAALEWAFGGGDPIVGCRLVAALNHWWFRTGRHDEGRLWAAKALAHEADLDPRTGALVHLGAGYVAWARRDLDAASDHWGTSARLAESVGDVRIQALCRCYLGGCTIGRPEEFDQGRRWLEEGLALAEQADETHILALGLNALGEVLRDHGALEEAEAAYRRALDLNRRMGDRHSEAINNANIAHTIIATGDVEAALPYYRAAMELSARTGSRLMLAWTVSEKALVYQLRGQPEIGARLLGAAEATLELLGAGVTPADERVRQRTISALTADLGKDRFGHLVDQGRAMTLEEAVELALSGL